MRALLVEDDPVVGDSVAGALRSAGFVVDWVCDGTQAWFRGEVEDFDVAVLDLGLPELDGLSVLRRWRAAGRRFPVIILSARSDWTDKVEGIETGADDYLAKPFEIGELLARARALVRRGTGQHATSVISCGALSLDTRHMTAALHGRPVRLSPLEFRCFVYLAHHPGRPVPAMELAEHLYGDSDAREANAIEALVLRLRRKTCASLIENRRGFGYLLVGAPP